MIVLFTDFGVAGPYTGQMRAVLAREAPGVPVIDLFSNAPAFNAKASAYLLAANCREFTPGTVFLCVVDPGVGGPQAAVALEADGRWYVAPDNGLLSVAARRAAVARWWRITWRPENLSASFHGRDLFAPVAARLALGQSLPGAPDDSREKIGGDWPDELAEIIYIDHYGNAMTGLRAANLGTGARLTVGGIGLARARTFSLARARTFSDVPEGAAFWYENANGLAEIAVNGASAEKALGLSVGENVEVA